MNNKTTKNGTGATAKEAMPSEQKRSSMETEQPLVRAQQTAEPPIDPEAEASARARTALPNRVERVKQEFLEQAHQLVEIGATSFRLHLHFTFSYIVLRVGDRDAYVDELLQKLKKKSQGRWAPDKSTVSHYYGPMLVWVRRIAEGKNSNTREKYPISFLRQHPQHVLRITAKHIDELAEECKSLTKLDELYGNDTLKGCHSTEPRSQPQAAGTTWGEGHAQNPAAVAGTVSGPAESPKAPTAPGPNLEPEVAGSVGTSDHCPSNEDLLARIMAIHRILDNMRESGVPLSTQAINELRRCVDKAGKFPKERRPKTTPKKDQQEFPGFVSPLGRAA